MSLSLPRCCATRSRVSAAHASAGRSAAELLGLDDVFRPGHGHDTQGKDEALVALGRQGSGDFFVPASSDGRQAGHEPSEGGHVGFAAA